MKILALESSAVSAGAAVSVDGKIVAENFVNAGLTHSQTLLPMVEACLKTANTSVNNLDAVAIANGPGSFTGLRIGASIVNTLAHELDIPLYDHHGVQYCQNPRSEGRCDQEYLSPHLQTLVCITSGGEWGRFEGGTTDVGTRKHPYNRDLYPH